MRPQFPWPLFLALALLAGCARSPVLHRLPAYTSFRHVPIGIGEDYAETDRTLERARADLQLLHTNGLDLLRISLPWEAIELAPGKYNWAFWDQVVAMAEQYHIHLAPYVCYTPRWASTSAGDDFWRQPPKDTRDFAEFLRQLVIRYHTHIHSWEIWNEPDNPSYWLGSVEQFEALLEAGSRAVHETDPTATVVMGGLAWNLNFLEAMLTNPPVMQDVQVVNLHNYYETWSEAPLERILEYVGEASDRLRRHGYHQPLWTAEVGYSSFRRGAQVSGQFQAFYPYEHTEEHQAATLVRAVSLLLASGKVSLITWYRLHDLPPEQQVIGDVNNRFLGVLNAQGGPKPALAALRFVHRLFARGYRCVDASVRVTKRLDSAAEVHAFMLPDGALLLIGWLRAVVPGTRSGPVPTLPQHESITVELPWRTAAQGRLLNELGQDKGTVTIHGKPHLATFRLPLAGQGVAIVLIPRTAQNTVCHGSP